ncbi:16664_t:CDS:2 [Rhizophagus irregularis]|nr:16664_t:CDS:2 [Rhizophagus irregularis]
MSIVTENYIGYDALVSYLSESKNLSYCRFLSLNRNTIIASLTQITSSSLTPTKWQSFNIAWNNRFLVKAKELLDTNTFVELKKKVRLLLFCKVWVTPNTRREVIKECDKEFEKENQVLAETPQLDLSKNNQEYEKENLLPTETSLIKECDKEYEEIQVLVETSQLNAVKVTVTEASLLPKRIVKISAKNHSEVDLSKKNVELINFCYDILHELENETNANLFYKYVKKDVKNMV